MENTNPRKRMWVIALVFVLLLVVQFVLVWRQKKLADDILAQNETNRVVNLLVEEFQLVSRDLTEYARAYCSTGNAEYARLYKETLDWQGGKIPRPPDLDKRIAEHINKGQISQGAILKQLGVNGKEYDHFVSAMQASDALTVIEQQVMESTRQKKIIPGPLEPRQGESTDAFVMRGLYDEKYQGELDHIAGSIASFHNEHDASAAKKTTELNRRFDFTILASFLTQLTAIIVLSFGISRFFLVFRRAEDKRTQVMLDATPLACSIWDEKCDCLDCNLEAAKLFGLSGKREFLERFFELSPEFQPEGGRSADLVRENIAAAFKTGYRRFEWMHQKPDGEQIPAEVTFVRVSYGDGQAVVAFSRDLREFKKLMAELRNTEADERSRLMLDATPLASSFWDREGNMLDCNMEAVRLFGLTKKSDYIDHFYEFNPDFQPDGEVTATKARRFIDAAFETGYQRFEWTYKTLSGEPLTVDATLVRVPWKNDFRIAAFSRDLRDIREKEREIRDTYERNRDLEIQKLASEESHERIRLILDAMPLCCHIWTDNRQIIDCNLENLKTFELASKDEFIAKFDELSPEFQPDGRLSRELIDEKMDEAFRTGRIVFEWTHRKLDGELIPTEITLVRVKRNEDDIVVAYVRDLREFNRMLSRMREADERTRIMLDATPLACNFWDENYNNIDCNQEAANLFDLSGKQEYLDRFGELSPEFQPDGERSDKKAALMIKQAFDNGQVVFEWMHQKLDGTPIPAEITLVRVRRGGGYNVLGYTRDLREFKKMLAEMRDADERTRLMLDATPLCCNLWDEKFNNIDCNLEAVKLFDLKNKQEYLERFFELSPPLQPCGRPTPDMAFENITTAFRDGYCRFEWMHQKLNGDPVPSEITLVRVKRGDDYIVAGYTRDLRELKKKEEALELDRKRTNDLLELSQMNNNDEQDLIDFTIKSAVSLTNSTMGYVVLLIHAGNTLPFRSLVLDQTISCQLPLHNDEGTPHTLSPQLTECLSSKHAVIHDDFAALDGMRVFPEGHFAVRSHMNLPILDGEQPVGIMGVGNKNTPYTEIDVKQLTLLSQGLSNRLGRKRYAENLEKARNEAENANSAKSEFLAHMSHEIRTPLNGVIGLSDLLIGTRLDAKQKEYVHLINASGQSLLFLINDILDFSKIEAGKLEIDSEPFDLAATVESVLGILVSRAADKNLELGASFCRNLPRIVRGDAGRIRQILLNLVGNAVKFTEKGGVRIEVELETLGETDLTFRFNVIDTGIGIPKNRLDRLFKAFSQADASSARVYGGTGLGLAISMKLVRLMGGEIGVESEDGKGSTFWFTVPFECDTKVIQCIRDENDVCTQAIELTCENRDGDYCVAFANRRIDDQYRLQGHRVIIVDDNEVQRTTLMIQLRNWEMECTACSSGAEAAGLLEEFEKLKQPFDILIVDNTLADENGIDLVRRLFDRAQNGGTKMPQTILLRPLSEEIDAEFLHEIDAESLAKPVFASALFDATMNRIFAAHKQPDDDTDTHAPDSTSGKSRPVKKSRPSKQSNASPERTKSKLSGKIHLLVVEDNRVNQIVAKNLLEESGFTCDIANNGHEACAAIRNKHYDIVLMDCQMPEMDGYEATDLIRDWEQEQGKGRIPIIALTANATRDDIKKCYDAGMDAYCSKPIIPQSVIGLIEEWYEKTTESGQ